MERETKANIAFAKQVGALLNQAEALCDLEPDMCEAASMVYIGDVYALREPMSTADMGWGERHYVADMNDDPL
ncbi:MAG: hypothetical protein OEY67_08765 [Gammaproteobacteria bacterium]|nr:hypothetical protein [Gammaproteobacteria bacterium]